MSYLSEEHRSTLVEQRENFRFRRHTAPLMSAVSVGAVAVLLWAVLVILTDQESDASMWMRVPLTAVCLVLAARMAGFARSYWKEFGNDRLAIEKIDAMLTACTEDEMLAACDMPIDT